MVFKLRGQCYRPNIISFTATKGGHLRGNGLYGASGTIG